MHIFLHLEKGYIEEKELDAFFYHMLTKLGVDVSIFVPLSINLSLSELQKASKSYVDLYNTYLSHLTSFLTCMQFFSLS